MEKNMKHGCNRGLTAPTVGQHAVCILTTVEPMITHYPLQLSLINRGAFHFKVVRRQRLDISPLSDKCL